jgi:hypothetical protein
LLHGKNWIFLYLALMIWVVDGHEVDVLVSAKQEVEVLRWNEHKKIIQVPVNMPNAEAMWTIRNLLKTRLSNTLLCAEERLEVFDRHWPIKLLAKKRASYMEDSIVHCYIKGRRISSQEKIKIKEELLEQFVLRHVGQWEETLDLLISHITFRKNKNKPYIVQRQKKSICFDKALSNLSLEAIAYCLFKAVADYGALEENLRRRFIEKRFPTWKTLEKIIIYAYATHDNH